MKKKIINCAIIGLGIGERHLETLISTNNIKIMGLCDFNSRKIQSIKNNYRIKNQLRDCLFTKDYKDILNIKNLDFVVISSYDNFHCDQIIEFAKKKINIFVEKPLCQNKKEFLKIKKIAVKKKIFIGCNFVLRENPIFKKLKKEIKKGIFGKIYHTESEYNYGRIEKIHSGWRGKIPFYSVNQGGSIHLLDIIFFIKKFKINKIFSLGNNINSINSRFKYPDLCVSLLKFEDGSTSKITSNFSCVTPHHHKLSIFGTKKTFEYNYLNNIYYSSRDKQKTTIKISKNIKKYNKSNILKKFVNNLKNNKSNILKKDMEGLFYITEIILKLDESMNQNIQ